MKLLLNLLILLSFISCSGYELTKTEIDAVQQTLNFYGGQCNRATGIKIINNEKLKYFELEFSKSPLVEYWVNNSELPASNIAYLFYLNLHEERSKYDLIKVKLNFSNGNSNEYSYSKSEISNFIRLCPLNDTISSYLKNEKYESLLVKFDSDFLDKSAKNEFISTLRKNEEILKQTQVQGFITIHDPTREVNPISIVSINQYDNVNRLMKIIVDPESEKVLEMSIDF